ncbi:hypothetical protein MSG28_003616 [Choristoneura fumiferana]|uniref:Uncharacterized protein n=1 Tax=Choristoneura fumiferana TaxID=7141 RepID=A0ACC0KFI6_CHOFU|nr:hypothetical protein MSG28_003616 [Choristoneura fumiferana]
MDEDAGGEGFSSAPIKSATKRRLISPECVERSKIKMTFIKNKRGLFKDHHALYEDLSKKEYPVLINSSSSQPGNKVPMDLLKINKALKHVQGVQYVKAAGNYFTKVYFGCARDANAFLQNKDLMESNNWSSKIPYDSIESQGIIRAPVELSEESLLVNLKASCTILGVKRFFKKQQDGCDKPLQTVLVTFLASAHPDHVTYEHIWMPVSEYIRPVLQCFKCYKFGHASGACKATQICSTCSGNHFYKECSTPNNFKCSNCSGPHSAVSYSCSVKAAKVSEVKNRIMGKQTTYAAILKNQPLEINKNSKTLSNLPVSAKTPQDES